MCDSKDLLVGYLYDELETSERRAFEAHLLSCGECRDELAGLRATRGQIAAWTPPSAAHRR
jgi:anti-sigma factor RsiW